MPRPFPKTLTIDFILSQTNEDTATVVHPCDETSHKYNFTQTINVSKDLSAPPHDITACVDIPTPGSQHVSETQSSSHEPAVGDQVAVHWNEDSKY